MKKSLLKFSLSTICCLVILSCDNDNKISPSDDNLVSKQLAFEIAEGFFSVNSELHRGIGIDTLKTIKNDSIFMTRNNEIAFYVINYNEGGFIILAADDRCSPVLAFSESDEFFFNLDRIPDAMVSWLEEEAELIEFVREEGTLIQTPQIRLEWDQVLHRIPAPEDEGGCSGNTYSCNDTFIEKGPLLTTTWGQWGTYNNLVPHNCPGNPSDKAPTGCVATAMAQVMRYHEWPATYNWSNMPNTFGTIDTQTLMADIGDVVNMDYGCNGSGANTESTVSAAFKGVFPTQMGLTIRMRTIPLTITLV